MALRMAKTAFGIQNTRSQRSQNHRCNQMKLAASSAHLFIIFFASTFQMLGSVFRGENKFGCYLASVSLHDVNMINTTRKPESRRQ